ncbi:hypothetical protein B296_00028786 [Ensete ventricosum]|uniref:4-hydroxy-4-methyl-2-oxoglutarate aldolase n=1 Tax=Ensete ventricosum TaxID=4639 RepID=A0A426ZQ47_ENSVE|nr:hypothetical protein B296_00028786 [Ensete ventricosum]
MNDVVVRHVRSPSELTASPSASNTTVDEAGSSSPAQDRIRGGGGLRSKQHPPVGWLSFLGSSRCVYAYAVFIATGNGHALSPSYTSSILIQDDIIPPQFRYAYASPRPPAYPTETTSNSATSSFRLLRSCQSGLSTCFLPSDNQPNWTLSLEPSLSIIQGVATSCGDFWGETLKVMGSLATAELCDANASLLTKGELRVLQPMFQTYGQCRAFCGPIVTLKVFEDNVLVREVLEAPGDGRVLVVDGGGSTRCALVGGNLGQLAQNMGWAGIVVNGCIRDAYEINGCDIGVRALGCHPLKSNKKGLGEKHVTVNIAGTIIHDGEWLYADSDGILISTIELSL